MRRSSRCKTGFTLIESLIALTILAVGVLSVAAGQMAALKLSRQSRSLVHAIYLAEEQLEAFNVMPAADLLAEIASPTYPNDPANPIDPDPGDGDQTSFNRRWTILTDTPELGVFTITIQVDWIDQLGITRTTSLESMRADL